MKVLLSEVSSFGIGDIATLAILAAIGIGIVYAIINMGVKGFRVVGCILIIVPTLVIALNGAISLLSPMGIIAPAIGIGCGSLLIAVAKLIDTLTRQNSAIDSLSELLAVWRQQSAQEKPQVPASAPVPSAPVEKEAPTQAPKESPRGPVAIHPNPDRLTMRQKDLLENIENLLQSGAITQEEYDSRREQILSGLFG